MFIWAEKYITLIRNHINDRHGMLAPNSLSHLRLGLRGVAWGSIGHVIFSERGWE